MTHDDEQRSGDADEIWQRLRALEDTPLEDTPLERGAVPPSDSTRMMPAPPPRTRGDGTGVDDLAGASGGDGAPGHYYVPAPQHRPQRSGAPAQPNPAAGRAAYEQQQRAAVASNPAGNAGRQGTPTGSAAKAGSARAPQRSGSGGGRLRRWFRPKLRWIVLYLPLLIMASIAALGLWGWKTVKDLGRVDVGDSIVAATGDTVNYLIVGSDSREGAEAEGDAGYIGDTSVVGGQRADTIIVLRVEPTRSLMMSIPRDLWATNVATGKKGRINGTFNQGPDNLVRSVTANLGIPINQYLEVDFVSFAAMVDAMGGVDVEFPHAVFDKG
ncbi:MAG TPA: LCP family protein, partial [Microthrixaceae bacterium]|nr:LCP family protein [Microthrixaceae bacterium]